MGSFNDLNRQYESTVDKLDPANRVDEEKLFRVCQIVSYVKVFEVMACSAKEAKDYVESGDAEEHLVDRRFDYSEITDCEEVDE